MLSKVDKAYRSRDSYLRRRYGITYEEYEVILASQGGKCWICGKPPKKRRLHIDHEHMKRDKKRKPEEVRAKIRGLLCWKCNTAIAKFKDNAGHMKQASVYVELWPAQQFLMEEIDGS